MAPLHESLRRLLEKAVLSARTVAETGARSALERMTVDKPEPGSHLSPTERELRLRLRARGHQAGDKRNGGEQELDHLVTEVAYEHWHRMLFARFLDENHFLMHHSGVSVTLEECRELAQEEGASNGWELAARYASAMLPEIFRVDDPVLALSLAPEHRVALEKLLDELPKEVFTADDSLGWVYQFWQAQKKDEVNKSGNKIGADELPAVTQLFTEDYMVCFLLHNSLGAWWAGKQILTKSGENLSEEELRERASLPGCSFDFLRFLPDGTPAAGIFSGWPKAAKELKVLDPCCGSGHFLIVAFIILVALRMQEEGLSAKDACDAVLKENLFGLEIDPRCTQIAAFNLAMTAWKYPGAGGYRVLPAMNIACCGLAPRARKEDWLALAGDNERLRAGMERLYDLFQLAPELGSLIDPTRGSNPIYEAGFVELQPLLEKALQREKVRESAELEAAGVVAQGLAKAATTLAGEHHLVITNMPYLAHGRQGDTLKNFCETNYPEAKHDLANVFLQRCLELSVRGSSGVVQIVMPQNWLFLKSYQKQRENLLKGVTWNLLARLGEGGFDSPQAAGAFIILLTQTNTNASANFSLRGLDASVPKTAQGKAEILRVEKVMMVSQDGQVQNPDSVISLVAINPGMLLSAHALSLHGISTTDYARFGKCFWEFERRDSRWIFQQSTVIEKGDYDGRHNVLLWEDGHGALRQLRDKAPVVITGLEAWGRKGIAVTQMRELPSVIYTGEAFDDNTAVLLPRNDSEWPAIFTYCQSPEYLKNIRHIDQSLKVTYPTLAKAVFDLSYWQGIAAERYPHGLPKPYSDNPTQWLFHGHPCGSVVWDEESKRLAHGPIRTDSTVLQVSVARMLGYRWPAQDDETMKLSEESRAWVAKANALGELPGLVDDDGVVCIPPVGGERPAAERLRGMLAAAYSSEWSASKEQGLLTSVGYSGKTLEEWLRDGFFDQHFKLFHHRPFIWQIWDGRRDGFSVLVNYHKLDHKLLERLTFTYLGDWIKRQEDGHAREEGGAESRLIAARQLQEKLKLILEGEAPYDIFVRWKPLHEQPIGWEPDLNDGVRLNIRPFVTAEILRKRPNIKWEKDRGKDVESAPWFNVFGGERINDHHLSLAEKREVRERMGVKK